jgi:xylulokinase
MAPELSRRLGFSAPPLVVSGGHDQACAALGVGLIQPGIAMVSTGTAEVVEVALSSPVLSDALYRGNISCYAHVVSGMYLAMTLNHTGGLLLRWFRDTMCPAERDAARAAGRDPYDAMLADMPSEPTSLLVLPHFAGAGTPWLDVRSKGAIVGLTLETTRAAIAKAMLEGLTFELRINLDWLRAGGVSLSELRAVGGGARSPMWLQVKADICKVPIHVPEVTEAACLGAALLAGATTKTYPDLNQAVARTIRIRTTYMPDEKKGAHYDELYAKYQKLYPALAEMDRQT